MHNVKDANSTMLKREERWTEHQEGEEYQCPSDVKTFSDEYRAVKEAGVYNKSGKLNTDAEWLIYYVPAGRVNYDCRITTPRAVTHAGCKKLSSYAGLGQPGELWDRKLTCGCPICAESRCFICRV